jgi:hypothetical protein
VREDICQIGYPELVRGGGDELAIDQVFGSLGPSAVADGGLADLLPRDSAQPLGLHLLFDGAAVHLDALAVRLGMDLAGAVDPEVGPVGDLDVGDQLGVTHASC